MLIMTLYYYRLMIYHLPPKEVIISVFLPLGPLGQGSLAIQNLGMVARKTDFISKTGGEVFYYAGILIGLVLWGYGTLWLVFAIAAVAKRTGSNIPFNIGWWAFTFPLGVFTTATTALATNLPSKFFKIVGTVLSVVETLLWLMVFTLTTFKLLQGQLVVAPCLDESLSKSKKVDKVKHMHDSGKAGP